MVYIIVRCRTTQEMTLLAVIAFRMVLQSEEQIIQSICGSSTLTTH